MDKGIETRGDEEVLEEVLKDIQARAKKYIEDFVSAELAEQAGEEVQNFLEAAFMLAEQTVCSPEEAIRALMNAVNGSVNPKKIRRALSDLTTARDRKEAREKRRAVERETASRFRWCKARENAWAARKRTRPRLRVWRGPWRAEKE